ncbi:hypothetical protein BSKO_09606 [Bryopsis sp. KO-2023]|nr:hypothetical protein BSKO_09606 [Bryopsis sp. KO-2023]
MLSGSAHLGRPCCLTSREAPRAFIPRQKREYGLSGKWGVGSESRRLRSKSAVVVRASKGFGSSPPREDKQSSSKDSVVVSEESGLANLPLQVAAGLQGTNVYLVGMMGSGKSSVGKKLAAALEYAFFDSDALVETATGATVDQVFAELGVDEFRKMETQVLKELHCYKDCIISTGGGSVLLTQNWSYMQQGIVVWLRGSPELLANRVEKDGIASRPLLADCKNHEEVVQKLDDIFQERLPYYRNADIEISLDTGEGKPGLSVDEVIKQILENLQMRMQEAIDEREDKKKFTIENSDSAKGKIQQPDTDAPFWKRIGELQSEE